MRSRVTEALLSELRGITSPFQEVINGIRLVVNPGVYPPRFDSRLLAKQLCIRPGQRVLDLGTGTGIQAIVAAKKGARVLATDISQIAIDCARANARRNRVGLAIEFRLGFLFDSIRPEEKFDVIIANLPFESAVPRDMLEYAVYDNRFRTMRGLFREAPRYLSPQGNIQMVYADYADMKSLREFSRAYHRKTIAERKQHGEVNYVFLFQPIRPIETFSTYPSAHRLASPRPASVLQHHIAGSAPRVFVQSRSNPQLNG